MTEAAGPGRAPASVPLRFTDAHARIEEDTVVPGAHVLLIGEHEQSHVNTADPDSVFYAYLDRMRNGIEAFFPAGAPLRVAHVGAGALTLARALESRRPGGEHTAVDLEPRLLPFVLERLPFSGALACVSADGRAWAEKTAAQGGSAFDLVVVDIFTGADSPAHLAEEGFYALLLRLLWEPGADARGEAWPGGLLAVNLGDDPPLDFTARQIAHLRRAAGDESRVVLGTEPEMLGRTVPGNSIALVAPGGFEEGFADRWAAAGPHPAWAGRGLELDEALGL
ncbi:spermidine synthase [Arthrobacter sp. UM1]|uniref:spermidine synthase n=1 Tax=Arthrobacter sp. UM1 TaxID=2766776 RepID=UPI001CF63561|nr:SAM-dependent methyltransferase [Arthrobacter sp. UM1]MCB4207308.1 SAM-dependent methyltransferase [Arthrobacter sp. UM1]